LTRRLAASESRDEVEQPLRLLRERARPGEERDVVEPRRELVDPDLDVALEREARVVEPTLEHTLVTGPYDLGIAALRDERKPVPAEREVALVRLHRGLHDAHGQLQEPLVEGPFEHDRPLDEMDDLLEYVGRVRPAVRQPFDDSAPPLV